MVRNWFQVVLAILNVGAGIQYYVNGNIKLAVIMILYGLACAVFATME